MGSSENRETLQLVEELKAFDEFGSASAIETIRYGDTEATVITNEFWTSKQRAASPIHEISYLACFKPQLARFFIERLSGEGDVVFDPFMGRGTTLVEAALLKRVPFGCDVNPLSRILIQPRFRCPALDEISECLENLELSYEGEIREELLVFYHEETLRELMALRRIFQSSDGDPILEWLQMVATSRLTGHSAGFFSVFSMPPNQAVSVKSQRRINERRQQVPPVREVKTILLKKSKALLGKLSETELANLNEAGGESRLFTESADDLKGIGPESVQLVVTSPPFLDVIDYQTHNWLRCWFNGIDSKKVKIWQFRQVEDWKKAMAQVFLELMRVLRQGGHVAFEVGEIRKGKLKMEELVIPVAQAAGFELVCVMVNAQEFTKTAKCWGVDNQKKGTNTNRIVLLRKPRG